MFDTPTVVFSPELLRPELQDREAFAAGMELIVESQRLAAQAYVDDGSIEEACPPLAAILTVMARGDWQGRGLDHPELRLLFTREHLLASSWYRQRLEVQQARDVALWRRHVADLEAFIARPSHGDEAVRLGLADRLAQARAMLATVSAPEHVVRLQGTIGADPMGQSRPEERLTKQVESAKR
ncbi:MAG: hypothetical protein H0V44_11480, partial [Planctomycetes bacterium]|nr:hypothetical protein [Planctomycetota bacterium]